MEDITGNRLHIFTLLVNRNSDIPKVRLKAKKLAQVSYFKRLKMVEVATAASELSRALIKFSKGGKISFYFVSSGEKDEARAGIKIYAQGNRACYKTYSDKNNNEGCIFSLSELRSIYPFLGLFKVFDYMDILGGYNGSPLKVVGIKWSERISWQELEKREKDIRDEIFPKDEDVYIENLRIKHEEVLRLLKEKARQNRRLERMNKELLGLSRDIEALAQERTLAEIALKVADKVRNPATAIGGLARSLLKKAKVDEATKKKIEAIFNEAQKLEKIVKNFENVARLNVQFFTNQDLNKLVKEVIEEFLPRFEAKKGIKVQLNLSKEPIIIRANKKILKIALLHVLRNAIDVSKPGKDVIVQVVRDDNGPKVMISDSGPGLPKHIKDIILKGELPSVGGLGLSVVHQILLEHQGSLKFEDKEGGGSIIIFEFPKRWKEQF